MPKMVHFGEFLKTEACGQTVLPDRPVLIGQKLIESAKIQIGHFESFSNNVHLISETSKVYEA